MTLAVLLALLPSGLRDRDFSSVGRAPFVVRVVQKRDGYSMQKLDWAPCLDVEYTQAGKTVSDSFFVSESEWDRVRVGRTYSLVRNRGVMRRDPNAIELRDASN